MVTNQVAHEPYENEIRRAAECFAQRQEMSIILRIEISERMRAAAGKEHLTRSRRVFPVERQPEESVQGEMPAFCLSVSAAHAVIGSRAAAP